jgi:hypothetical protein
MKYDLIITDKEAILKCGNAQKRLPLDPLCKAKGIQEFIEITGKGAPAWKSELIIFWDLGNQAALFVYEKDYDNYLFDDDIKEVATFHLPLY